MAEHAKQRLLEIVQEETCESLKSYLLQTGLVDSSTQIAERVDQLPLNTLPWNTDFLDGVDIFGNPADTFPSSQPHLHESFEQNLIANLTWTNDNEKEGERADSAYGSNVLMPDGET
jgi:hypothetical protein